MTTITPQVIELDICGQICPASLLVALREINRHVLKIKEGSIRLLIRTDNRDGTHTIPEAAYNMGLKVEVQKNESCYVITIGKR